MGPESFLPRLEEMHEQLLQSQQGGGFDPELADRLRALTADLKAAVHQATMDAHAQAITVAAGLQAKAEAIERKMDAAKNPPPPGPNLVPWEDHQGLTVERMDELVAGTLSSAASPASQRAPGSLQR